MRCDKGRYVYIVTGSSGRLGGALCATLRKQSGENEVHGMDPLPGPETNHSLDSLSALFASLDITGNRVTVLHCGALHKPQVRTHTEKQFLEGNVEFTMQLLQACKALRHAELMAFVYTSTTSVFGERVRAKQGAGCEWIDESTLPAPKNIYGWSKLCVEELVRLYAVRNDIPGARFAVLRACRFFPECDDREATVEGVVDEDNLKFVHCLNGRRLTLHDVVAAHLAFLSNSAHAEPFLLANLGNATLLQREDCEELGDSKRCAQILLERYEGLEGVMAKKHWKLPQRVDRVYDCSHSFALLQWRPRDTPLELMLLLEQDKALEW